MVTTLNSADFYQTQRGQSSSRRIGPRMYINYTVPSLPIHDFHQTHFSEIATSVSTSNTTTLSSEYKSRMTFIWTGSWWLVRCSKSLNVQFFRHCPESSPLWFVDIVQSIWSPSSIIVRIHSSFLTTGCFICFMEVHYREYKPSVILVMVEGFCFWFITKSCWISGQNHRRLHQVNRAEKSHHHTNFINQN